MNIVITGSSRGIGLGMATAFVGRGHRVMLSGRDPATLAAAATALGQPHHAADVGNRADMQALWDAARAAFGTVDIWVNNAGITGPKIPFTAYTDADIDAVVRTNLHGLFLGTTIPLAGMTVQGHGTIYSFEGFGSDGMTAPGLTLYGTTKRALGYFTRSMQKELKDSPVRLGTISPGIVVTDLVLSARETDPAGWEKSRKLYNILADRVETVAPWIVTQVLAGNLRIRWLTTPKAAGRFLTSLVRKRQIIPA
ncbi:SDR family oxidoreductase [Sandaracinobacteroides saxicola]|uniref:SDR family oxidoreductase n=1 Tax=Sandaracinobacteroides saxicola TaxID=2759707 RepID=A0A7G5IKH7_9SPHN|nr:SDR family oxidoreductase [Sandaracinobacteroides saxicola]QMW23869.1 SDR family oxidoreductase [Sandaracinobacteroides saxicola]